jgi:phage shock protein A
MDWVTFSMFDRLGAVATVMAFALAVITDKLVWHTRLKKAEARADRWEQIALDALTAGAQAGVAAAEMTVDVVSALPDPNRRVT